MCNTYGCTDVNADNYDEDALIYDNSCIYYGCTDSEAINYDDGANSDDGTCYYTCENITVEFEITGPRAFLIQFLDTNGIAISDSVIANNTNETLLGSLAYNTDDLSVDVCLPDCYDI